MNRKMKVRPSPVHQCVAATGGGGGAWDVKVTKLPNDSTQQIAAGVILEAIANAGSLSVDSSSLNVVVPTDRTHGNLRGLAYINNIPSKREAEQIAKAISGTVYPGSSNQLQAKAQASRDPSPSMARSLPAPPPLSSHAHSLPQH